ncbi:MAG: hypothetical protein ACYS14_13000 [Planctomycetota bacterium]|jgi:hypothetical protein
MKESKGMVRILQEECFSGTLELTGSFICDSGGDKGLHVRNECHFGKENEE